MRSSRMICSDWKNKSSKIIQVEIFLVLSLLKNLQKTVCDTYEWSACAKKAVPACASSEFFVAGDHKLKSTDRSSPQKKNIKPKAPLWNRALEKSSSLGLVPKIKIYLFFPELNEPARPAAARPASHDVSGQAAGGSAVRTERRGQDRRKPAIRGP